MTKVGRNDPCPCGSGLKFERCHGAITDPSTAAGNLPLAATSAGFAVVGFPGQHEELHLVNRFKEGDPRNELPVQGSAGLYEVTFILRRPGYALQPERQISFANGLQGDSHLAITRPAFLPPGNEHADQIKIYARTEDGAFEFMGFPNARGFLGKLVTSQFQAANRRNAEDIAYRALSPSLSEMSLHLDVPLEIGHRETKEMLTGNTHISFVTPFIEVPLAVNPSSTLPAEYRGIASLYREAMNTNSPVFQFLCLYKIIEALRARRIRLARAAKRTAGVYVPPTEVLPTTHGEIKAWLDALFYARPEWDLMAIDSAVPVDLRGMNAEVVINDVLNPLRINAAHALFLGSGELGMSSDDLLHTRQITLRLAVTKCLVRRMLKNDFPSEFLNHLPG